MLLLIFGFGFLVFDVQFVGEVLGENGSNVD